MNQNIIKAINFATKAHHGQTRKGSKKPYIIHPLTVGIILSRYDAPKEAIIAGILHDTIEDCHVTEREIAEKFSPAIASVVFQVSNLEPYDNYQSRTEYLLKKVRKYSFYAALVRSADILANGMDVLSDYDEMGDAVFEKFKGTKDEVIYRYSSMILTLEDQFPQSALNEELHFLRLALLSIKNGNPVDKK